MKKVNLIIVIHKNKDKVLMCYRENNPYKGKYNFVGGKLEANEADLSGAYRELYEETGITKEELEIKPLYFSKYFEINLELQVYYGFLDKEIDLVNEINPLEWISLEEDFSNESKFAGDGNVNHMIAVLKEWYKL